MASTTSINNISKLQSIRKTFLWAAVCILIGELVVGALIILTQGWSAGIGKIQATFFWIAVVLFAGINNFAMMEKDNDVVRWSAIICFVSNLIWLALAIPMIWEVIDSSGSVMKICFLAADVAATSFWVSNVLNIKDTIAPVKPLKITSIICVSYCCLYCLLTIFSEKALDSRWGLLASLAGLAFIITAIIAAIVSGTNDKKKGISAKDIANDSEIQSAIQDLVEKEIQARLAAQGNTPTDDNNSANQDTPASANDSMAQASKTHDEPHRSKEPSSSNTGHIPKRDMSAIYPDVKKDDPPEIHPDNDSDSGDNSPKPD